MQTSAVEDERVAGVRPRKQRYPLPASSRTMPAYASSSVRCSAVLGRRDRASRHRSRSANAQKAQLRIVRAIEFVGPSELPRDEQGRSDERPIPREPRVKLRAFSGIARRDQLGCEVPFGPGLLLPILALRPPGDGCSELLLPRGARREKAPQVLESCVPRHPRRHECPAARVGGRPREDHSLAQNRLRPERPERRGTPA